MKYIRREESDQMLEDLLVVLVQKGQIEKAKKNLEECKPTFSHYQRWYKILYDQDEPGRDI